MFSLSSYDIIVNTIEKQSSELFLISRFAKENVNRNVLENLNKKNIACSYFL